MQTAKKRLAGVGIPLGRIVHGFDYFDFDYLFLGGYSFPPKSICLIISEICNLKCTMCDIGHHRDPKTTPSRLQNSLHEGGEPLSLEQWQNLIVDIASFTPKPLVLFTGTEPLLYPAVFELIATAVTCSVPVHLTTNGTKLAEYAESIVALCQRPNSIDISVSIDDIGSRHDKIRGVPGTFQRAIDGIRAVFSARERMRKRYPYVHVTCTISSFNQDNLEKLVGWFFENNLPVTSFTFNHLWFKDRRIVEAHNHSMAGRYPVVEENCGGFDAGVIDLLAVKRRIAELRIRYGPGGVKIHEQPPLTEEDAGYYYNDPCRPVFYNRCTAAWRNITITPRGNVLLSPLCFFPPSGNIKEEPLTRLWNGQGFRKVRRMIKKHKMFPACSRCCMLFGSRPKYYKLKELLE